MTVDTVKQRRGDAGRRAAVRRARPQGRRVRTDPRDPRPPPDRAPSWRCTPSCGASTAPTSRSKVHLRQFGEKAPQTRRAARRHRRERRRRRHRRRLRGHVQGRVATTTRRYVEPYQGAATGVGGIVRDILTMGARPVAVMDPLRFGAGRRPRHPARAARGRRRHRRLRQLPRPAQHRRRGRLRPDLPRQPARQRAVRRRHAPRGHQARARVRRRQPGHPVRRARPAATASAASRSSRARPSTTTGPAKRPSVQVGDPFTEKVLIECCLEIFAADLVVGIQDLGGAGLSCATSELASHGDGGMHVELDRVPLRDADAAPRGDPHERVAGAHVRDRRAAPSSTRSSASARKWDVARDRHRRGHRRRPARRSQWHGETVVDVPPRTVAHEGPVYERPYARPAWQDALQADGPGALPRPATGDELRETVLRLVASPNLASSRWVTEQYDRYVLGNTVLAQPEDAGVVRRRRGDRPRRRARDRRQRPLRQARPVRRRAARAGRGLPQRRGHRRAAARRHRLPQLRLARGPRRDVAVRRGHPRPRRRLPRARRPGHRRQRQLLQPDRRRPRSTRRRWSACSASSTTSRRRTPIGFGARRRRRAAARRDPRRARRLRVGARRARSPRRPAAARRPRRRARARPSCSSTAPRDGAARPPRTTSPTAASRRRSSRWRCGAASGASTVAVDGDPFVALFTRVDGPRRRRGAGRRRRRPARARARSRGVPVARLGTSAATRSWSTAVRGRRRRAARRLRGHAARPLRLTG